MRNWLALLQRQLASGGNVVVACLFHSVLSVCVCGGGGRVDIQVHCTCTCLLFTCTCITIYMHTFN